jgi:anti-sigma-K factor RskA
MNREQLEELAALDAMGALDGDDLTAWEAACSANKDAAALRDEFAAAAAQLALLSAPAVAPAGLKRRVMNAVFADDTPAAQEAVRPNVSFGWPAWAAAAAVALLAIAGTASTTARKESVVVRDDRVVPGSPFVELAGYGDFGKSVATVLWDSGQRGWWLQAFGLPKLPSTYRYHVWAVCGNNGALYDCGELPPSRDGQVRTFLQPDQGITSMCGFVVTVEPSSYRGSAPSSPAVLITPGLKS